MHGIVLKGLKDFVIEAYDEDTWNTLLDEAGIGYKLYLPVDEYPDEEVFALVETAVELTDLEAPELLETFGRFLVDPLLNTYGVHVDGEWTAMELVANVETYIHEALRSKNVSNFTPPELSSRRVDQNRVIVEYSSDRGLCALAEGLLHGVADHYDTAFRVVQRQCMHDGGDVCELVVEEVAETGESLGDRRDQDVSDDDPTDRTREVTTVSGGDER